MRNRPAQILALGLVCIASVSLWLVNYTGHEAFEQLRTLVDEPGADWMDAHLDRAESAKWAFYALAALAAAAALVPLRWPRAAFPITIAAFVLGVICIGLSGWIAKAGGPIRHSEFRFGAAPSTEQTAHEH